MAHGEVEVGSYGRRMGHTEGGWVIRTEGGKHAWRMGIEDGSNRRKIGHMHRGKNVFAGASVTFSAQNLVGQKTDEKKL